MLFRVALEEPARFVGMCLLKYVHLKKRKRRARLPPLRRLLNTNIESPKPGIWTVGLLRSSDVRVRRVPPIHSR